MLVTASINPLQAQNSADTLSIILESVDVEATHSVLTLDDAPISISTFRRANEDIVFRRASTMDEITFTLPGIWINNRENHALGERMTVRGMGWRSQFGVRGIQVVMDGIPLTVADGQTILNMIDPAMVRSVELLRGPAATFWGNSSGGVLLLKTNPDSEAPVMRYRSYLGSHETMKHELQISEQIKGVKWDAYSSYHRSDGYRDHSASELIRAGLSAGFDLGSDTRIEARGAYSGMPYAEHPGSLLLQEIEEDPGMARQNFADARAGKKFQQIMGGITLYQNVNPGLFTFTAHNAYRDLTNPLPFSYIDVNRQAGGVRSTFDFSELPFQLQAGAEIKWQRDSRWETNFNSDNPGQPGDESTFDQSEKVNNQALFTQAVIPVNNFAISLGLRADRMQFIADDHIENEQGNRIFTTLNPSAGITYKFNNSRIFANLSTSFESPTTTEFKNRPSGARGFNEELNPERTIGIETGTRGIIDKLNLSYDVTIFGMRVKDLIIPFDEDQQGRVFYRNEGKTLHTGIESQFRLQPFQKFQVEWMYTYLNVEFQDGEFEGNKIPGVTPHRFSTISTLHIGDHRLSVDAEWVHEYYTNSDNTTLNDDYLLFNSRWMYDKLSMGDWKIQPFLSVYNLLNKRYNSSVSINAFGGRYFEPGSNRNFQFGFSVQFK